MNAIYDVAIIGGGINGCACAADAALRGLSVLVLEQGDLASQTSSSSTKLIHGGLRYLENYEFSMVKKALVERQRLLQLAPHLVRPQPIVLPWQKNMRPAWLLRMGLFLYDHLSLKNALMPSQSIKPPSPWLSPLHDSFSKGFVFYDAKTDDARLTLENALQAKNAGATIYTYTKFIQAQVKNTIWHLDYQTEAGLHQVQAKSIINTSGPWVNQIAHQMGMQPPEEITLVKGSHIIIPALYEGEHGYLLQHKDKRVIFVLPYHGYTMVGTTDILWEGSLKKPTISDEEIHYLCDHINSVFNQKIKPSDIVSSFSGLRTLISRKDTNISTLSRDYIFHITESPGLAVTVYGGKLTTYRKLAEHILNQLAPLLDNNKPCFTKNTALPGAVIVNNMSWPDYKKQMEKNYYWLKPSLLQRYLDTYGTRASVLLEKCHHMEDLGTYFGHDLYEIEVTFLMEEEWAKTPEDILWRRTRLGFKFNESEYVQLSDWFYAKSIVQKTVLAEDE